MILVSHKDNTQLKAPQEGAQVRGQRPLVLHAHYCFLEYATSKPIPNLAYVNKRPGWTRNRLLGFPVGGVPMSARNEWRKLFVQQGLVGMSNICKGVRANYNPFRQLPTRIPPENIIADSPAAPGRAIIEIRKVRIKSRIVIWSNFNCSRL